MNPQLLRHWPNISWHVKQLIIPPQTVVIPPIPVISVSTKPATQAQIFIKTKPLSKESDNSIYPAISAQTVVSTDHAITAIPPHSDKTYTESRNLGIKSDMPLGKKNTSKPLWEILKYLNLDHHFDFIHQKDFEDMCYQIIDDITGQFYSVGHREAGAIISRKVGKLPRKQFSTLAYFLMVFAHEYSEHLKELDILYS